MIADLPQDGEGAPRARPERPRRRSWSTDAGGAGAGHGWRSRRFATPSGDFWPRRAATSACPKQEERALGVAARERGDLNAARTLVVHNLRLVISIAYQYRRAWTNILDLFQEGSVGLMEAVKRWEPKLGPRFGTYAAYWIRAYVLRFLMTNSRLIHVGNTRAGRKLFFRLEKERQKLLAAGIDVTPKLLAAKLDVDEKELDEVRQHLESREVPFDPRPGETQRRRGLSAVASGCRPASARPRWRRRAPSSATTVQRARRRLPRQPHRRARAGGLARAPGRGRSACRSASWARASASRSSAWARSPTSSRSASAPRSSRSSAPTSAPTGSAPNPTEATRDATCARRRPSRSRPRCVPLAAIASRRT